MGKNSARTIAEIEGGDKGSKKGTSDKDDGNWMDLGDRRLSFTQYRNPFLTLYGVPDIDFYLHEV